VHIGAQKITMTPLNFSGEVRMVAGLDFSELHQSCGENLWDCSEGHSEEHCVGLTGTTKLIKQKIYSCCRFFGETATEKKVVSTEKLALKEFTFNLKEQIPTTMTRIVSNVVCKETTKQAYEEFEIKCQKVKEESHTLDYATLLEENRVWWKEVWNHSDIAIEGDELNQQGIRFCIFQMNQTYHGTVQGTNIGAKGLTGEAYNGNAFWDTEVYCLPYFLFNNLEAAKNLLMFRYVTLPEAKERAKSLDCEGAFYPIATITGTECCDLWQHASLQLQASTAVSYGIWFYEKLTGDQSFLREQGLPMLVEISRMLSTRGSWTENNTKYGYYSVMGPDEFQMMVNHNYYTNYMGKFTLEYTLKALNELKEHNALQADELRAQMNITEQECEEWAKIVQAMVIPYDVETNIYEQHDGYFKLPHVDVDAIPTEDFPLYHNWSYDRIYRNDMIKQPDVLMLMLLFNSQFSEEVIKKNYEYYEPRCIHESSLSPSVHSILASQLKKHDEAYEFFKFTTRMDLDNYNRNSHEGLHTTSLSASWMNIIYGFGGMRSDGEGLKFSPSIPKNWQSYSFRITYLKQVILVHVQKETVSFQTMDDTDLFIEVYGTPQKLSKQACVITIPNEWRG
ncbi:MAG: family 65 glycosyl hydrolase, partial [Vallitaleaceae bacterium]|nr:family 65 glycosyl hydrolase [Vallitaleaceae bacterium]